VAEIVIIDFDVLTLRVRLRSLGSRIS